jgi:Sec-independent protein translocase protein TatA
MKRLKIIEKGWETYTGFMSMVSFVDGVSVDPVPQHMADRITASVQTVEIDEDGGEIQAGAAARLVGGATLSAEIVEPLAVATAEEIAAERAEAKASADKAPVEKFYTAAELEVVADDRGIKGLREIAAPWGVRGRAIPELIREIMQAQGEFQKRMGIDAEVQAAAEAQAKIDTAVPEVAQLPSEASLAAAVLAETMQALKEEPEAIASAPADVPADAHAEKTEG